jgi:2-keto-4-pentenoate hydratase/2-oxohepta-3-ene-1,7-dioic acid hydratase in catechol pathway
LQLVTFVPPGEAARVGVHRDGAIVEVAGGTDMLALLQGGPDALARAQESTDRSWGIDEVELRTPVPRPGKIFALAANYADHIVEGGGTVRPKEGRLPLVFCKLPSSLIGPNAAIVLPSVSQTVDWELEIAVVIGQRAKNVPAERALEHVAGYAVFNDVSARTMSYPERTQFGPTEEWFDFINGKWVDTFAAMGPYLVTKDEVPDPDNLKMQLRVSGTLRQDANSGQMIFKIPETIEFVSRWSTLEPGDVIATGTPAGTGEAIDVYLQAGDVVEGTIERLGTLVNPVAADESALAAAGVAAAERSD